MSGVNPNMLDIIADVDMRIEAAVQQVHALNNRICQLEEYRRILLSEKKMADFARETVKLQTGKDV